MTKLGNALWARVDLLVPDDLKHFDHREVIYRGRACVLFQLMLIGACASVFPILIAWDESGGPARILPWISVSLIIFSVINLWQFKNSGSFSIAAHIYGATGLATLFSIVMVTGGFLNSPFTNHWVLVVVYIFIIDGLRSTVLWAAIGAVLWALGLWFSDSLVVDVVSPGLSLITHTVTMVVQAASLFVALWFFSVYQNHLLVRLHLERDHALFTAAHDSLTGIANRKSFENRLEQLFQQQQYNGGLCAVLMIDLDNFKPVNDKYGHLIGDQVLATIAERIASATRRNDIAARLGGDEFGLLISEIRNAGDIDIVAQKIVAVVSEPIVTGSGDSVVIGASIGIALVGEDGSTPADLLGNADKAMYGAKRSGAGYCRYSELPEVEGEGHPEHGCRGKVSSSPR